MVTMKDEPRLATAHLTEIGKLTVLTAQIEYHLAGITAMLISPTVSEVGYKVVGKQHFATLATLAKRVLPEQLTQDSPAADLSEPITAWIGDAERIMNWRNQLLHAVWMIYAEQQTATVLRRAGDTEDVPLSKLLSYVTDAEGVSARGRYLWLELTARYGHFDSLIEATKAMDPEWWAGQE